MIVVLVLVRLMAMVMMMVKVFAMVTVMVIRLGFTEDLFSCCVLVA